MRPQIAKFAVLATVASAILFASIARSAETASPPDASPKPSGSTEASAPRTLSDAQIEALIKEIGIRYGSSTETASRAEAKTALPPPTAALPDAQRQVLLREMADWYDSRMAGTPGPKATLSQLPSATDPQRQALLREMKRWYDSRIAAAPRPEVKFAPPSRHHWRHYSIRAESDRGEATRLMREELQQRGVAVDTAAGSGDPQ